MGRAGRITFFFYSHNRLFSYCLKFVSANTEFPRLWAIFARETDRGSRTGVGDELFVVAYSRNRLISFIWDLVSIP